MKVSTALARLFDLLCREACRACIERCHMVAGRSSGSEAVGRAFFNM